MLKTTAKIVTFVPESHADQVRQAIGEAGAGKIGNYSFCSFSTKGTGRFLPLDGANPTIGTVGNPESVEEERIEAICESADVQKIIGAIKKAHPYEEVPIEVYRIEIP
jgi:hypothetical protein